MKLFKEIIKNMVEKLTNKTLIIIVHRLETIKDVDNIFVLKDGKMVEEGTYLELLNKKWYFKELYKFGK